jgi:hypothetical protein
MKLKSRFIELVQSQVRHTSSVSFEVPLLLFFLISSLPAASAGDGAAIIEWPHVAKQHVPSLHITGYPGLPRDYNSLVHAG